LFALPADIDADLRSITAVRNRYRRLATQSGATIIEVGTPEIAGCLSTIVIIKDRNDLRWRYHLAIP
jgi:hypothetical protein